MILFINYTIIISFEQYKSLFDYFVSSVYFEESDKLYLGINDVKVGKKNDKDITIDIDEKYPKTIDCMGEELEITDVDSRGKISFKVPNSLILNGIKVNGEDESSSFITIQDDRDYKKRKFILV
ncbi:hypothetical protein [Natranaerobius trueperi]|uniref:Uncharacterized protein n=1 Tax=Natranaerobius trueperi TaxID=759412 RepID=A0A226C1I0_9FIRM|nr:hypothetical protein [Natranaerobius trueperi]OWZ85041.1 hypothetical protein CDO51_01200 [Natranaerobius trueperi]